MYSSTEDFRKLARLRLLIDLNEVLVIVLLAGNQILCSLPIEEEINKLVARWAFLILSEDNVYSVLCHSYAR